jgi:hypothetical protein
MDANGYYLNRLNGIAEQISGSARCTFDSQSVWLRTHPFHTEKRSIAIQAISKMEMSIFGRDFNGGHDSSFCATMSAWSRISYSFYHIPKNKNPLAGTRVFYCPLSSGLIS